MKEKSESSCLGFQHLKKENGPITCTSFWVTQSSRELIGTHWFSCCQDFGERYLTPRSTKTCFKDILSCMWFQEGHKDAFLYSLLAYLLILWNQDLRKDGISDDYDTVIINPVINNWKGKEQRGGQYSIDMSFVQLCRKLQLNTPQGTTGLFPTGGRDWTGEK